MKLTGLSSAAGCAAKLDPTLLASILKGIPKVRDPKVLVGFDHADDAAVYRLDARTGLVFTTDFFPPVLDDPFDYGQVAAANALSDVYAMGGIPLMALNLVCFPAFSADPSVLGRILAGGAAACRRAGCAVVGGHSVTDDVVKFGLAVLGTVDPDRIATATGMEPGSDLVLTKPLGTGIVTTALKRGRARPGQVARVTRSMASLNAPGQVAIRDLGLRAATDITGFGLLGHLKHLVAGSKVSAEVWIDRLPLLPGARDLAAAGYVTGGGERNRKYVEGMVRFAPDVTPVDQQLCLDPQTSGGILLAVPREKTPRALALLARARALVAAVIGRTTTRSRRPKIQVLARAPV